MARPIALALALAMGCVGGSGCSMFSSENKTPHIRESQLNWLEVCFLPGMGQPPVKLSLLGSGNIRIRRGSSPQIKNDFSQDVTSAKWNDVSEDQINVLAAEMRDIYQAMVDRGLLLEPDKDFILSASRGVPQATITGSLNNDRVARVAVEPELVGYINSLIKLFEDNKTAAQK